MIAQDIHLDAKSVQSEESPPYRVYIHAHKALLILTASEFIRSLARGKAHRRLEALKQRALDAE